MQEKNVRLNEFSNLGLLDGQGFCGGIVVVRAVVGGVEVRHHSHLHLVLPRRREVVGEACLQHSNLSYIHLGSSVCHPVVLSYSCHIPVIVAERLAILYVFIDQTDQGNETKGLEMEGL
jgi:hypothetical protein